MKVKGLSDSEMDDILRIIRLLLKQYCVTSRKQHGTSASHTKGKKTELSPMAAKETESTRVKQRYRRQIQNKWPLWSPARSASYQFGQF